MRLIVDVMNVLHAWRAGPAQGKAGDVAALARAVAGSRFGAWDVVLVADGTAPSGMDAVDGRFGAAGCAVVFSGAGVEADAVIEGMLEEAGPVRETVVVSDDGRVRRAARRRGARWMASGSFAAAIGRGATRASSRGDAGTPSAPELGSAEVDAWLAEFGVEERADPGGSRATPERDEPRALPEAAGEQAGEGGDLLREAAGEWGIADEDLDMQRWLDADEGAEDRGRG